MSDKTRTILFWGACIPLRLAGALSIAIFLHRADRWIVVSVGVLLLVLALIWSLMTLGVLKRKSDKGGFGGFRFWDSYRTIHAVIFAAAGGLLVTPPSTEADGKLLLAVAGTLLVGDVAVGVSNWLNFRANGRLDV